MTVQPNRESPRNRVTIRTRSEAAANASDLYLMFDPTHDVTVRLVSVPEDLDVDVEFAHPDEDRATERSATSWHLPRMLLPYQAVYVKWSTRSPSASQHNVAPAM